jgi:hypothetical protein
LLYTAVVGELKVLRVLLVDGDRAAPAGEGDDLPVVVVDGQHDPIAEGVDQGAAGAGAAMPAASNSRSVYPSARR